MTRKINHLKLNTSENVYPPREDSLLLAGAVSGEVEPDDEVLEIGCGSGLVSLTAARKAKKVKAVDINPEAVELTRENAELNRLENIETAESDLFENVEERFSLILFNPPYLPTEDNIQGSEQWSGGKDGREVIERFIEELDEHLKEGGRALLLISSLTGEEEVEEMIEKKQFKVEVVAERKVTWEKLFVLKIERQ
ncbi:MAG: HemK2/MTQ2 family protein methyltransferase [Candidatus Aenigmatarchaeota archaeon]